MDLFGQAHVNIGTVTLITFHWIFSEHACDRVHQDLYDDFQHFEHTLRSLGSRGSELQRNRIHWSLNIDLQSTQVDLMFSFLWSWWAIDVKHYAKCNTSWSHAITLVGHS